jgi:hypothetical protein
MVNSILRPYQLNSLIVPSNEDLFKLCEFSKDQKWKFLYRASQDGFKGADFHHFCDDKDNTLTIVKSSNGNVFGGFTRTPWTSSAGLVKEDESDFIFSLINTDNQPLKMKIEKSAPKLRFFNKCSDMPCFGNPTGGFSLSDDCDAKRNCMANLGGYFKHSKYLPNSKQAKSFLAGSPIFKVLEIEVFQKI